MRPDPSTPQFTGNMNRSMMKLADVFSEWGNKQTRFWIWNAYRPEGEGRL